MIFFFASCRSFHLVIGTAFIAVANFVGQLMDAQTKRIVMMILLCQNYSRADYVSKNVRPIHTYNLLFSRYTFFSIGVAVAFP